MFERKNERLAPRSVFFIRLLTSGAITGFLIAITLSIGIIGYHWIAGFDYVDSLLEASMILAGMGPVNSLHTIGAKIFASLYALFSGLVFIVIMGIILAPVTHRILHKFHLENSPKIPTDS